MREGKGMKEYELLSNRRRDPRLPVEGRADLSRAFGELISRAGGQGSNEQDENGGLPRSQSAETLTLRPAM